MSAFSHRHYEAIAWVIANVSESVSIGEISYAEAGERLIVDLERMFVQDNPKFDLERFRMACWKERV
jgi:hypothetical protein